MRTPLIAGNWKLNKTVMEASELVTEMLPGLKTINGVEIVLCPPFTALMTVSRLIRDTYVLLGAQNMFWEQKGAYTGEISPAMLAEFCQYVILGHSERRANFDETDAKINRKVRAALANNLKPILCVGETLDEYEAGRAAGIVSRQLKECLAGIDGMEGNRLVIAYEPVWAIGTGRAATAEGVNMLVRNVIRPTLSSLIGEKAAEDIRVLYGGSVDPKNAPDFFKVPGIDGALVGGASLNARSFIGICEAAGAKHF
jgi:triosephosphate isomerase